MAEKKFRNMFREYLEASARKRKEEGQEPFTQEEWTERLNKMKPAGKKGFKESTLSRWAAITPRVARRVGIENSWVLGLLNIEYSTYLEAWGSGPEGGDE